jgi:hypothetical protein
MNRTEPAERIGPRHEPVMGFEEEPSSPCKTQQSRRREHFLSDLLNFGSGSGRYGSCIARNKVSLAVFIHHRRFSACHRFARPDFLPQLFLRLSLSHLSLEQELRRIPQCRNRNKS